MRNILIIAHNTFRELLRNRLLYMFVFFALFILLLMFAIGQLSYTEQFRLTLSLGLACVHLGLISLTFFVGGTLVFRELERKTVLTLLARPVRRSEFLLGKYLGLLELLLIFTFGFFLIFYGNSALMGFPVVVTDLALVFVGIFLEVALMLAVTIFFSTFCASFLAVMFSLGVFLIGHWSAALTLVGENDQNRRLLTVAKAARVFLPNLEMFNWRSYPLEHNLSAGFMAWALTAALLWTAAFFTAATLIFARRDFD